VACLHVEDEHARAIVTSVREDDQLRARCRAIVERTVPDLTVRDPLALRLVASLLLVRGGETHADH
jgi:hypothetical protein